MNGARRPRFCALQRDDIGSVDPHALKIPARRAEYSLPESALSPFQAEPTQNMFLAARELAKGGEFSFFSYLKEWDPEKEQRSYDKHSMGDSVSQYQYPTVVQEFE